MRAYPQWICWRLEPRPGGKPAKVPVDPRGRSLRGLPTESWGVPFEEALAAYLADPTLSGIGFVFKNGDPFWFLDIDGRSSVHPEVRQALARIPSWAEWSQSRQGCHIIFTDDKALSYRSHKSNGYEIYYSGRYVAMTGMRVETSPPEVMECPGAHQFALDVMGVRESLVEEEARHQATAEASEVVDALRYVNADDYSVWIQIGMALRTLGPDWWITWDQWSSNSVKYSGPESTWEKWSSFASDGGPDRVNIGSLFHQARQGGWRGARVDATQVFQPVQHPVAQELGLAPDNSLLADVSDLADEWDRHRVDWTVYRALPASSVGVLYGPSMSFKSYLLIDLAAHIALGISHWHGHPIDTHGPVIFLLGEGFSGFLQRIDAWRQEYNRRTGSSVTFKDLHRRLHLSRRHVDFSDLAHPDMAELERDIREIRPALVIQDTWSANNTRVDESRVDEVAPVLALMNKLARNLGTTVLVTHHTPKTDHKTARGTGAFLMNVDFQWSLAPDTKSAEREVILEFTKVKVGREPDSMKFRPRETMLIGRTDIKGRPLTDMVLDHLGSADPVTVPKPEGARAMRDEQKTLYDRILEQIAAVGMGRGTCPGITYQEAWEAWCRVPAEVRNGAYATRKDFNRAVSRMVTQGHLSMDVDPTDKDRVWIKLPKLGNDK